jgi:protein-tyrosine phosphatase
MAGVSRSATLVIAYLMSSRRLSFNDAFKLVKSRRKIVFFMLFLDQPKFIVFKPIAAI